MLSKGLVCLVSDFEAENAMLKGNYLWQVLEIGFGGVPTVLEVRFMCLFMPLRRILLQGSVSTNLFVPKTHPVDLRKVQVRIGLLGDIYHLADKILQGIPFAPHRRRHPGFSNVSPSIFRFCTRSILTALALAVVLLPACHSKKTPWEVGKPRNASSR
jgi:hypothetical protein